MDGQDVQHRNTDFLISVCLMLHFRKHGIKVKKKIVLDLGTVKNAVFFFFLEGEVQAFHTDGNITQRLPGIGAFRMGRVGVDDNQVVFFNRNRLIFYKKAAASGLYVEQLCKMMGMHKTWPVAFVVGNGYVKKTDGMDCIRIQV